MQDLWTRAALVLLSAGSWWVAEEAADGRGLILSAGWCVVACLFCFGDRGAGAEQRQRSGAVRGWMDAGVLLLVVGHVVSTWHVFQVQGDRRAAVNLTLEWCGLLGAWLVLSRSCVTGRGAAVLLELVTAIAVGQACLGTAQHHFVYASNAEWYRERREILDAWSGGGAGAGLRSDVSYAQVQQILAEFRELQIPLEGSGRVLWENRALYSQEPIGTFALANTLAGLLAAGLLIMAGRMMGRLRSGGARLSALEWVRLLLPVLICGYCLVLTKSRSAWLGVVFGGVVLAVGGAGWGRTSRLAGRLAGVCVAGLCGLLLAGAVLVRNGSLDSAVLAEAPRSLQFRLMYWTGAVRMLREQPWTGAGPGNFRESYMPWKADESSEEIRDPHNLLLDAWSSSGVIGLAGLLLLLGAAVRQFAVGGESVLVPGVAAGVWSSRRSAGVLWRGLLLAFVLDTGWEWLSLESLAEKWLEVLLLGGMLFVSGRTVQPGPLDRLAGLSGLCGLSVHLLAAGGFEMPAVMLVMLVCLGVVCGGSFSEAGESVLVAAGAGVGAWSRRYAGAGFLVLAALIVWLGAVPALRLKALLGAAEQQSGQGNPAAALRLLDEAERADRLAVRPHQQRVELLAERLLTECAVRSGAGGAEPEPVLDPSERARFQELLENCEAACERLIEADIRSPAGYLYRGRCRGAVGRILADLPLQQQSCEDYDQVLQRYRGKAVLWAEFAESLWLVGELDRAIQAAGRALALQRVNERWGHQEQLLGPAVLKRLEQLTASASNGF
ncbi:MAG: O-antigen ligase family protein [Planctomyces sp.]